MIPDKEYTQLGWTNYYVVEEVQSTFRGMEIAIAVDDWKPFAQMNVVLLA